MHSTFIYQPFYTIGFVYMEYQMHFLYIVMHVCEWLWMGDLCLKILIDNDIEKRKKNLESINPTLTSGYAWFINPVKNLNGFWHPVFHVHIHRFSKSGYVKTDLQICFTHYTDFDIRLNFLIVYIFSDSLYILFNLYFFFQLLKIKSFVKYF